MDDFWNLKENVNYMSTEQMSLMKVPDKVDGFLEELHL